MKLLTFTLKKEQNLRVGAFKNENIVYIECQFPLGKKYIVTGEGHPNKMAHKSISECVHKKLSLTLDKL